ncbi:MAG: hypothetical protein AAGD01_19335 [Acidobacteriota bacterium]
MIEQSDELFIDFLDIQVEDIKVLSQEGSRGIAEFAASTSKTCSGQCSCTVDEGVFTQ